MGWLSDPEETGENADRQHQKITESGQAIAEPRDRRDTLELGFRFVLIHDADLLQRLKDA